MTKLIAELFLVAVQQHYDRELVRMRLAVEQEREAREAEWQAMRERSDAYVAGLRLTAPAFATPLQRERSLRHIAPQLGEHELRGAIDGYEQAVRPVCPCCERRLDTDRELAPNPNAN